MTHSQGEKAAKETDTKIIQMLKLTAEDGNITYKNIKRFKEYMA